MIKPQKKTLQVVAAVIVVMFGVASIYTVSTWPYNVVGWITYRVMGKPFPSRATELQHMKQFLAAKRKLNKKQYDSAYQDLEYLRQNVTVAFPFFKEIYLYLGYIYDIRGDFRSEEALHRELEEKDKVFAGFLRGLYAIHHGRTEEGKKYLSEAVKLDNQLNKLGKYRGVALKALGSAAPGQKKNDR